MSNLAFNSAGNIYDVPSEWSHRAYLDDAGYLAKYEASIRNPDAFWAEEAKRIHWFKAPTRIKNTNFGPGNVAIRNSPGNPSTAEIRPEFVNGEFERLYTYCEQYNVPLFFSTHARSVTILCRGEGLEKSMSRYLVDQIASRSSIRVLHRAEVAAAHGDIFLEAIDVRDAATGDTTRLESGGLFMFIGADAETAWLPPEIALDGHGYVLTGPETQSAGRWELDRDPYLLETSVPGIFACGDVRSAPVKRVAAAVGEGSMAIAFVHQYLKDA